MRQARRLLARERDMHEHDVVGIGNAIVDIIAHCDDAFLSRHDQRKVGTQEKR
jgi:hypothetical protein